MHSQARADIEAKYAKQKTFLLNGLKRAMLEEEIHKKQVDHRKYRVYDAKFGQSTAWNMRDFAPRREISNV